ncbi:MAG: DUF512 domain-containing protein [Bacillota bacterium]
MNNKDRYLLLKTVQDNNILPITSKCNLQCKFCSHFQNPPELKVKSFGNLDFDFIKQMIDFLPKEGAVILGESATKFIEGEPLFHPNFKKIIKTIRNKWPKKEIRITTNGSFLNEKLLKFFSDISNLNLNISLNCSSPEERNYLMNDKNGANVFSAIRKLKNYNIKFSGSIVALPHIMGWKSIKNTILFLDKYNAETIRVFMPAFTDYSSKEMKYNLELYSKLKEFVNDLSIKVKNPIIFEPPYLENLDAKIEGIIQNTVAAKSDLKTGDIIKNINGKKVFSRVEAFSLIKNLQNPSIGVKRGHRNKELILRKKENEKSGLVMHYDLSKDTFEKLKNNIFQTKASEIILITSQLAKDMMEFVVEKYLKSTFVEKNFYVINVKNNFFGGSIITAGLLTVNDIKQSLEKFNLNKKKNYLILLASIIFDDYGNDLIGNNFKEISEFSNLKISII